MLLSDAFKFLESHGKLDKFRSSQENAVQLLEMFLIKFSYDEFTCASITYVLHVIKSNSKGEDEAPSFITDKEKTSPDLNSLVKDWLVTDYTEDKYRVQKRFTLKCLAQSVRFTIKIGSMFSDSCANHIYIPDTCTKDRARISEALNNLDDWDWDVWKLHKASSGRPLQTLGWHLLHEWGLVQTLKLDRTVLSNWLAFVEALYHDVPYHNSAHAADVLHATHYLLSRSGAADFLPAHTLFAVLAAAMIHDAGHDGLNNLFHQNAQTDRALAFNDQSVQENYHAATVLARTARDPAVNVLGALDPAQAREARRLMILVTLGTDMKQHFAHARDLDAALAAHGPSPAAWAADPAACDRLCAHVVHAADVSNTCRPFGTARGWADRVMREFGRQGDRERALGLPVSPLCARGTVLTSTSQVFARE